MADPVRRRLLRVLEDSTQPCDVESLAAEVSLHPNTVRGHLEILERAGLVLRATRPRTTPGRPRLVYTRSADSGEATAGGYRLLAEILASTVDNSSSDPAGAAETAGRHWGRNVCPPPVGGPLSAEESVARITDLLTDIGFEPETEPEAGRAVIELTDCPFRDLAREHPDIICALHLGLMQGAAEALGGATHVESLHPFVEPSRCRAVIAPG